MLGDMGIQHIPKIAHNPEENGIAERINSTIMNAVRTALDTACLDWTYWTYVLADVVDKYNQLPHSSTGKSPHQLWHNANPDLRTLFIFGQEGFVPIMSQPKKKHEHSGQKAKYLRRDGPAHVIVETDDAVIRRFRADDFHPYQTCIDLTQVIMDNVQIAIATRKMGKFTRAVPWRITSTTPAPVCRAQAGNYPDSKQ